MQIRFADYTLDDDRYLLERAGEPVTLRPKVFDLLIYLIRHRERVVRREELVSALWDHVAVGDGALSGLVNELRQALGERGRGPSSIRTVHARGYQFVTPVATGAPVATIGPVDPVDPVDAVAPVAVVPTIAPVATPHTGDGELASSCEPVGGLDAIGCLIKKVAEQGSAGVVIESYETIEADELGQDCGLEGRMRLLGELVYRAEQTGFDVHRLVAPDESQVSPSRFARQVIDSMIARRGREVVCAALPLPARRWLEDEVVDRVAGGLSRAGAGPPDPLGSVATLLRVLSCRRPLVILLEDLTRAGTRFAADLLKVKSRLSRAPVLWVMPIAGSEATAGSHGRVTQEAGFEHWLETPPRRTVLDHTLRRLGLEPLPEPLFEALAAHVRGDEAGLSAIAEWAASVDRTRSGEAGAVPGADSTARAHPERAAGHPMKRVEPAARRPGLRSVRT